MSPRAVHGACQLLFARHDGDTILLDLIAMEPLVFEDGEGVVAGSPFILGVRARREAWTTDPLVDALARAAADGRVIDLELIDAADVPTAVVRTGDAELVLEIDLSVHG